MTSKSHVVSPYDGLTTIEFDIQTINVAHYLKVLEAKHERGILNFPTEHFKKPNEKTKVDFDALVGGEVLANHYNELFYVCSRDWAGKGRVLGLQTRYNFKFYPIHLIMKSMHPYNKLKGLRLIWDYNDSPFA